MSRGKKIAIIAAICLLLFEVVYLLAYLIWPQACLWQKALLMGGEYVLLAGILWRLLPSARRR